jgi:hypothetical protein
MSFMQPSIMTLRAVAGWTDGQTASRYFAGHPPVDLTDRPGDAATAVAGSPGWLGVSTPLPPGATDQPMWLLFEVADTGGGGGSSVSRTRITKMGILLIAVE